MVYLYVQLNLLWVRSEYNGLILTIDISIISDRSPIAQVYVDVMRRAGFNVIDSNCSSGYSGIELSCKQGVEFGVYYEAVE